MKDFRNLRVWEKAHKLCSDTYEATAAFPTEEMNGLTAKIRQVASHIPISIARGCGYNSQKEYMKHIQYAANATSEFEYLLVLSNDLGYMLSSEQETFQEKLLEVRRMLFALVSSIRNKMREAKPGDYIRNKANDIEEFAAEPGNEFDSEFEN